MSDPRQARTERRRAKFLASLREHGIVARAVRAAGGGRRSFYDWRAAEPGFAAAWDAALAMGLAALEDEAMERAWRGRRRGIWYQGRKVGVERMPSDGLLMFMLRHRLPERYGAQPWRRGPTMRDGRAMEALSDAEIDHAIERLRNPEGAGPPPEPSAETRRAEALRAAGFLPAAGDGDGDGGGGGDAVADAGQPDAPAEPRATETVGDGPVVDGPVVDGPVEDGPVAERFRESPAAAPAGQVPALPPATPPAVPPDTLRDRLAGGVSPMTFDDAMRARAQGRMASGRASPSREFPF